MAIGTGAAILGGSLVSGYMGKKSADKAGKQSQAAMDAQVAEQRRQYDQTRTDAQPYRDAGVSALSQYQDGIGGYSQDIPEWQNNRGDFSFNMMNDPGAQYGIDQAMKATSRQHAAQGGFNSGNVLAALNDRAIGESNRYANDAYNRQMGTYNTNMANDRYDYGTAAGREGDMYGRNQNYLSQLGNLATAGQNATFGLAGVGQNTANQIGSAYGQNAANQIGAQQFGANSMNNAVQGGMSNYLTHDYLNSNPGVNAGTSPYWGNDLYRTQR